MNRLRNTLVACAFLALSTLAHADTIITGATASGDTFNIDAVTTPFADGVFQIIDATGTVTINGVANNITGIENTTAPGVVTYSSTGFFIFDNLLYTAQANPFDYYGALFTLATGNSLELNLFYNNADPDSGIFYNNSGFNSPITSTGITYRHTLDPHGAGVGANGVGVTAITATPEPSSFILLGSGLMASAFALRKKMTPATV